jgi:hypothetical protein
MDLLITDAVKVLTEACSVYENSCYTRVYECVTVFKPPHFTLCRCTSSHSSNGLLGYTRILLYSELSFSAVWALGLFTDVSEADNYMAVNDAVPDE